MGVMRRSDSTQYGRLTEDPESSDLGEPKFDSSLSRRLGRRFGRLNGARVVLIASCSLFFIYLVSHRYSTHYQDNHFEDDFDQTSSQTWWFNRPSSFRPSTPAFAAEDYVPVPGSVEAIRKTAQESVLAIKSGYGVAYDRVPVHLVDGRTDIPNRIYGAEVDFNIGPAQFHDLLADVSEGIKKQPAYQPYHELQQSAKDGSVPPRGKHIWSMDRYKNVMMQALHAKLNPDASWYLTMDGDSFMFWQTVMRWLSFQDPNQQHYFGRFCGGKGYRYAQGGAGYVVSKGLSAVTYGSDPDYHKKWDKLFIDNDWGEAALSESFYQNPAVTINTTTGGDPMFFEHTINFATLHPRNWLAPLFTFHHVNPMMHQKLRNFEKKHYAKGYLDVRFCDLVDEFAPRFMKESPAFMGEILAPNGTHHLQKDWKMGLRRSWRAPVNTTEACHAKCDEVKDCFSWTFEDPSQWNKQKPVCYINRQAWSFGEPIKGFATGYRLDRITEFTRKNPCKDPQLREKVWNTNLNLTGFYYDIP